MYEHYVHVINGVDLWISKTQNIYIPVLDLELKDPKILVYVLYQIEGYLANNFIYLKYLTSWCIDLRKC